MAGVKSRTPLANVLDLLTVIMLDITRERSRYLTQWRQGMDRAIATSQVDSGVLDRNTWGLQPHQVEQQRRAMDQLGRGG